MKLILVIVLLALIASASAEFVTVHSTVCPGSGAGIISNLQLEAQPWPPKKGQELIIQVKGLSDEEITGGTAKASVFVNGKCRSNDGDADA